MMEVVVLQRLAGSFTFTKVMGVVVPSMSSRTAVTEGGTGSGAIFLRCSVVRAEGGGGENAE